MRSWIAGTVAAAVVLVCGVAPASAPTVSTSVRLLTNALIMDGTFLPTPSPGFMQQVIDAFIAPALGGDYTGVPVTTPEQVVGINQSIADGATDLEVAITQQETAHPGEPFVVFGYSQSTMITMLVKASLEEKKAAGQPVPNVTFVGIGGGDWPNGSITSRLSGLVVPLIDFTFNGAPTTGPTDAIKSIQIARQYDGFADTPEFISDPVADANAVLGAIFVHGLYPQEVSLDPSSPKYVPGTVEQHSGQTTYYWIPTADLPLFDPLRLAGVPESLIDVVQPLAKVLVDAGYDRSVPFSQPTPAQLIPVIDPVTLTIELAAATLEGANNAAKIVGGSIPGYAALQQQLTNAENVSAGDIGVPYRNAVTAINDAVNPVVTFDRLEAPVAERINTVTNGLGIPKVLNQALDSTFYPFVGWFERNVLTPTPGAKQGLLATIATQFLKRVAPKIDAGSLAATKATPNKAAAKSPPVNTHYHQRRAK